MDLKAITLPELKQLNARLERELAKRATAAKSSIMKRFAQMAREEGFSLDELLPGHGSATPAQRSASKSDAEKPASAIKTPLPARYRHPSNSALAWSGRGRKPQWIEAWVANGGSLTALETAAEKFAKKTARTPKATNEPGANA